MHALRQALHQFRAHPWFNTLIVLLLALGIGANTTMFSLVHAVLLKPLPYPQPGELVMVRKQPTASSTQQPGRGEMVTDKEFLAWEKAGVPGIRSLAAYTNGPLNWRRTESTERVSSASVTDTFFPLLGVTAFRGRLPGAEDAKVGASPVAALSYDFWQSRFGGRDDVLGTTLTLEGEAVTIVGVLPPFFQFNDPAQVWRPLALHEAASAGPGGVHRISITLVRVLARLQPGADLSAAQAQLDLASQRLWDSLPAPSAPGTRMMISASGSGGPGPAPAGPAPAPAPGTPRGGGDPARGMMAALGGGPAQLVPLQEYLSGAIRPTLWLLLGAVALVLLIACVNVANLQLARATVRRHELAVRTALGASRGQLALGLLAESLLPAVLGGLLGILLSVWGIDLVRSLLAAQLPRVAPIGLNLPVAAFTLLLAVLTGIAFGLAPAWQVRRLAPQGALHSGGRTGTGTPGRARWRQACVAVEVALALALVADAGLLLKSYLKLRSVDLGFRTDVLTVTLPTATNLRPTVRGPDQAAAQGQLQGRLRETVARYEQALATVPGVKQFAVADRVPLSEFAMMFMTNIEGYTPDPGTPPPPLSAASVGPDYFSVLGIALREGRLLSAADGEGAPLVVVVNEAFARRYFPGQSVIGRRLVSPAKPGEWATVVGVVADTRRNGQDADPQAQVYFPLAQWPQPRLAAVIRFTGEARLVGQAVLGTLRKLEPGLPFDAPITLEDRLDRMLAPRALIMGMLLAFAAAAVVLAALGIFGVMAYAVAQRTHEFGVRMALGADRSAIIRHVLAGAGTAVGLGVAGGLVLAFTTSRLLAAALFAVTRTDPLILIPAAAGLALIGIIASLVPALRAARVNPLEALRAE